MEREIERLREALRGLSYSGDGGCWCEVAIGNPMCRDHSDACKRAHAVLKGE